PAVPLDLLLSGPATEADAAALALEVGPASGQPRQQVFELCHLDLHAALGGDRPPGEDREDRLGAVEHRNAPFLLQVSLLARRELVVAEHSGAVELGEVRRERGYHTGAEERRRVGLAKGDQAALEDLGAKRARQLLEFVELDVALLALVPARNRANDDPSLQLRADGGIGSGGRVEMGQLARHRPGQLLEHSISLPTAPDFC